MVINILGGDEGDGGSTGGTGDDRVCSDIYCNGGIIGNKSWLGYMEVTVVGTVRGVPYEDHERMEKGEERDKEIRLWKLLKVC